MCILCYDENQLHDPNSRCDCFNAESVMVILNIFLLALVFGLIGWSGYMTHVLHDHQAAIHSIENPLKRLEVMVLGELEEQYYISTIEKSTGRQMTDHLPRGVLMPKAGPDYESVLCKYLPNAYSAEMWISKQFELDFRNLSSKEMLVKYEFLEIRFEVPWGPIIDDKYYRARHEIPPQRPSAETEQVEEELGEHVTLINGIYYIYDEKTGTYIPQSGAIVGNSKKYHMGRCPTPVCSSAISTTSGSASTCYRSISPDSVPYTQLAPDFYMYRNSVRELYFDNVSNTSSCTKESEVITHARCYCSADKPPRFTCALPIPPFTNKHGFYRLDLGFVYQAVPQK